MKVYITRWPAKGILVRELLVDAEGWALCDGRTLKAGRDFFTDREAAFEAVVRKAEAKLVAAHKQADKYERLIARLHETGGSLPQEGQTE